MKIAVRKSTGATQRRDQMLNERGRAPALRVAFPEVGLLRIELVFGDRADYETSPQLHTLYPAATAFFRFACPCHDCNGDFDLTAAVAGLLENASSRKRGGASESGTLTCAGVRFQDRPDQRACPVRLTYKLIATPKSRPWEEARA
jgi:hypothetical protein